MPLCGVEQNSCGASWLRDKMPGCQLYEVGINVRTPPKLCIKNRKAQLTQRVNTDSGACLKAHCDQDLSSPISAVDIRHDDYKG